MAETRIEDCSINEPIDAIGTTLITEAASRQDWDQVYALLKQGADARRHNTMGINALYYAVVHSNPEVAEALYRAGVRLDAVNSVLTEIGNASAAILMLNEFSRRGINLFFDENNTISECCQKGEYEQAASLIDSSDDRTLTEAIPELLKKGNYRTEVNLRLVEKMVKKGGKIDLERFRRFSEERHPAEFRNPQEYTASIIQIAETEQGR